MCEINCIVGHNVLSQTHIRPMRVGSLDYPECYRNLGASFLSRGGAR